MRTPYLLGHLPSTSAAESPEAAAVVLGEESVDYGTLEGRSNRVARALRAENIRPGDRVGLHMKKTPEAIIALIGILKAGACVVPVGLGTPGARMTDIARQCAMRALVTTAEACVALGPEALAASRVDVLLLAGHDDGSTAGSDVRSVSLTAAQAAQSPDHLEIPTVDCDLAYVLFTSGSTGSPKGVMLSHRAVLTFVNWASEKYAVGPQDRLSSHAPLNFDLSTFDVFGALGSGASVTLIPEGLAMFPGRLAQLVEDAQITVWYSVPAVLTLLVTRGQLATRDLSALRLVLFAGEVFPIKYLRQLMLELPAPRYVNLFGPTETNVCTYYEVSATPGPQDSPLPIGRACENVRTVVLDEAGGLVTEPDREGLLHVGGSGLMDGYYGRPEETAAVFTTNELTEGREERLYCTGDWVTIDAAGEYRFVGRRDHMVKVGGYRIELGEIESALYAHPAVEEVAAVAVPDPVLGSRIRAVVVVSDPAADAQQLKRHCGAMLPKYMVPSEIAFRDVLPRTATDKVDRPLLASEP